MRGTLLTTCNTSSWGTSTGVTVCRVYKVLFSFMVVALAFTFFHIVIDVIARRNRVDQMYNTANYDSVNYRENYKLHTRNESSVPALGVDAAGAGTTAAALAHGEDRNGVDAHADVYNALDTVRHEDTASLLPPENEYMHRPPQYSERQFQAEEHDADEYFDGIPDIPPTTGVRWASAATRSSPYSPLQTRFDAQQPGYEPFRPHETTYDEGGHGYQE